MSTRSPISMNTPDRREPRESSIAAKQKLNVASLGAQRSCFFTPRITRLPVSAAGKGGARVKMILKREGA